MSEVGLDNLKTVADAIAILDATPLTPRVESIPLTNAAGRILAAPILADRDAPPFDKALMDGYAVRSADSGPRRVRGEIAAGQHQATPLAAGECVAIMTGAPLPPGADAVTPVEQSTRDGELVKFTAQTKPGNAVQKRAAEATAWQTLLPAGTRLTPAAIAVCATVGAATLSVFARPRVGVLNSGDEIVPYTATPVGPQIRNSNTPLLLALLNRYGFDAADLGHVPDDPAAIAQALSTPGYDAIVITGGMSMGTHDYTPRVLRDLGYEFAITKLKMKPGKPFVFARMGLGEESDLRRHQALSPKPQAPPFIFGLPGNPVSGFVCTVRLASRLLLRMAGASPEPEWVVAKLADALPANGPREFYQPAVVEAGIARVPAWNGSADLFRLAVANALLVRMADEAALPPESEVTLLRLP